MKKILSLLLAVMILVSLCACQGNFGGMDLQKPVDIPADGKISAQILSQLKNSNAIGIFKGESNGISYEWTIFGSDIAETRQIDLSVTLTSLENGNLQVALGQTERFGFSALLSITMPDRWNAQSATAYQGQVAVASVSLTVSKNTILNISLNGTVGNFVICPDALAEDDFGTENTDPTEGTKDQYLTDPVPEGKPKPVEPEDQDVNKGKTFTCTFSIECATILNNLEMLDPDKLEMVPSGGVILGRTTVTFYEGESVFDVLQRVCKEKGIHMEASWTPIYNSAYVEGIHNLYEFDCGALSGWMYKVNGWYPNYGSSRYQLQNGDVVEWRFTCDLGNDIGGGYAVGG